MSTISGATLIGGTSTDTFNYMISNLTSAHTLVQEMEQIP